MYYPKDIIPFLIPQYHHHYFQYHLDYYGNNVDAICFL